MKFGEIFKGLFGKKPAQETPEQTRARLAGIEKNIKNINQFQQAPDSSSATRAADEERLKFLEARRQELQAKLPSQSATGETQVVPGGTGSAAAPSTAPESTSPASEGEKAA